MNEAFHGLFGLVFGVLVRGGDDGFRDFHAGEFIVVAKFDVVADFDIDFVFLIDEGVVFFEIATEGFSEGFIDTGSHRIVEVWDALATVLLVLVGLKNDGGEGGVRTDTLGGAKMATRKEKLLV